MNAKLGMHLSGKVLDCSIASDNFVGHEDRIERSGCQSRREFQTEFRSPPTTTYRPADHLQNDAPLAPRVDREAGHWAQDRLRATGPKVDPLTQGGAPQRPRSAMGLSSGFTLTACSAWNSFS